MSRCALAALLSLAMPALTQAKCELVRVATLPITMEKSQPVLMATIDGREARLMLDSGAWYSMLPASAAQRFALKTHSAPRGLLIHGVGGSTVPLMAIVKEFTLRASPLVKFDKVQFLIGGSEGSFDGVVGQNLLLERYDVEYDLGHGSVNLFKSEDCANASLAYWVKGDQTYSAMSIEPIDNVGAHTIGTGTLNGQSIKIMFDTGASVSTLSLQAAARAGIKPESPGVTDGGGLSGFGSGSVRSYLATFDSFKVGDQEEIRHAKLRFGALGLGQVDMLLGADFFLSHRLLVGNRERRLFLTYNGGAVFNLSRTAGVAGAALNNDDPGTAGSLPPADAGITDPAELARRGSALAARHDFVPALAELSRAIELDPENPEYFYQRANAFEVQGDLDKARSDLSRVLELRRDFLPAYLPLAAIKLKQQDAAGALADLDAVNALAPRAADLRYMLAIAYQELDHLSAATEQYGVWMESRATDSRYPMARARRCLCGALQNEERRRSMADCEYALQRFDRTVKAYADLFVNRGLLFIRQGELGLALADMDSALKLDAKNARALYVRAVLEGRSHRAGDADRDAEQARALDAKAVEYLEAHGFTR